MLDFQDIPKTEVSSPKYCRQDKDKVSQFFPQALSLILTAVQCCKASSYFQREESWGATESGSGATQSRGEEHEWFKTLCKLNLNL